MQSLGLNQILPHLQKNTHYTKCTWHELVKDLFTGRTKSCCIYKNEPFIDSSSKHYVLDENLLCHGHSCGCNHLICGAWPGSQRETLALCSNIIRTPSWDRLDLQVDCAVNQCKLTRHIGRPVETWLHSVVPPQNCAASWNMVVHGRS